MQAQGFYLEIPPKANRGVDGSNPNLYLAAFYVLQFSASDFMA